MSSITKSKPVIIGSYALYLHKLVDTYNDIDLILDLPTAQEMSYKSDKKKGNMIWFKELDKKIDITIIDSNKSNLLIYDYCNVENITKTINILSYECVIAPLEILYILKKSHVHRIIP